MVRFKLFTIAIIIFLFYSCSLFEEDEPEAKVVYVSKSEDVLYTQNLDGTDNRRLYIKGIQDDINSHPHIVADSTIMNYGPLRWSPDGTKIAVVVNVAYDASELIILTADGRKAWSASLNSQMVSGSDWSPDGTKIAYTMPTTYYGGAPELFITDLETNTWKKITDLSTQKTRASVPRWNSDGTKIYFSIVPFPTEDTTNIGVYDIATDRVELYTTIPWAWVGSISGDGTTFYRTGLSKGSNKGKIYSYNITKGIAKALSPGPNDESPRLVDNDQRILYTQNNSVYHPPSEGGYWTFDFSVWLMDINGNNPHRLPHSEDIGSQNYVDVYWR
jgi:Tol biopolymer transport system component